MNRSLAWVCLVAGVLGALSGAAMVAVDPEVDTDRYSYPLTAGVFVAAQLWFAVQHLGLLAGQVALRRSGAAGQGRDAAAGHMLGLLGMGLLTATEVLAATAADSAYPSARTDVLDALYGVSCLLAGIGLIMVGVAVFRRASWSGWRRWLPLALGIWVFVPMTPGIALGYTSARLTIGGWMVLYALLGLALLQSERRFTADSPTAARRARATRSSTPAR